MATHTHSINPIQHNDGGTTFSITTLSKITLCIIGLIATLSISIQCHYTEGITPSIVLLSVAMLSVVTLNVIMLNVEAPKRHPAFSIIMECRAFCYAESRYAECN